MRPCGLLLTLAGYLCCGCGQPAGQTKAEAPPAKSAPEVKEQPTYQQRRASFQTRLVRSGPAPQDYVKNKVPPGARAVIYSSGRLKLMAWVLVPPGGDARKQPALLFLHGGFAFGPGDAEACRPFLDAGFVVMCPMLRGENGNQGNFELFLGEVDDAKAAAAFLTTLPFVDRDRIYAFGHSAGGGISAVLSLLDDVPIRHCGSSGGLYNAATFDGWREIVPIDLKNPEERSMRLLLGNIRDMRRRHYAYLGTEDRFDGSIAQAKQEIGQGPAQLEVIRVPGDHFSSFGPALKAYLKLIQEEKK